MKFFLIYVLGSEEVSM